MITLDLQQGSPEWHQARLGIPTASQFHRLVTPKKREPSKAGARSYMLELIAERVIGQALESASTGFMARGTAMEEQAVAYYELQRSVTTEKVGFVLLDDRSAGASPDRLCGPDGGLEIKCPGPPKHIENMLRLNPDYVMQAQGCMLVTERQWWDIMSYNPDMPPALYRVERDEECMEALRVALEKLAETLLTARADLLDRYGIDTSPKAVEAPRCALFEPHPTPEGWNPRTYEEVVANLPTEAEMPF